MRLEGVVILRILRFRNKNLETLKIELDFII